MTVLSKAASSTSMTSADGGTAAGGRAGRAAALPGRLGARLFGLRLGVGGRLHRGEVYDAAHGHVSGLHAYILPRVRAPTKRIGQAGREIPVPVSPVRRRVPTWRL